MIFKIIKNIFKQKFNKRIAFIFNVICLLVLFYNAIDMTFDYLRFEFTYKLIVDDNKEGFDLPEISVCTENNIIFTKTKVIQYFGVDHEWQMYRIEVKKLYVPDKKYRLKESCIKGLKNMNLDSKQFKMDTLQWRINYCLNKFFIKYNRFAFKDMSFYEMNSITVNENDLFDISAKIHFRPEFIDPNVTTKNKYPDIFRISKSIYFNNDFGICFTVSSNNYQVYFKENDNINITVKFQTQKDFMIVDRYIDNWTVYMHSLRYFVWYVLVSDRHSNKRETAFVFNKVGFDARISFEMTSIELLSTPYMDYCVNNGNYSIISKSSI